MLPASGAISMSQINNSGTNTVDLQSLTSRIIGGKPGASQPISMSNFYYTQTGTRSAILLPSMLNYSNFGLGSSMAISSDGNTLASGNLTNDRVYIFTRSGNTWSEQTYIHYASGNYSFGTSVALSGDGNTLVIGSPGTNSSMGTGFVYTRSGTTWTKLQEFPSTNKVGTYIYYGYACSISDNGNTIIVGAPQNSSGAGGIWIYEKSGSTYTETAYFLGAGGSMFGSDVDCNAEGTIIVGGTYQRGVSIYTKSGSTWSLQQSIQVAPTQGGSVSMSADGKFILSGSGQANYNMAHTIVYMNGGSGLRWYNGGDISPPAGESNVVGFGWVTRMSADANVCVMGSWQGDINNNGKTWIYEKTGTAMLGASYTHKTTLVGELTSYSGYSMAISGNGSVIASGAEYRHTNGTPTGAVYIIT